MNESDAIIFVVDDDDAMRRSLAYLFDSAGWKVQTFESARDFLQRYEGHAPGCLLLDVRMPLMSGLELQQELSRHAIALPVIFLSGHGDLAMAVQTMKAGACDFLESRARTRYCWTPSRAPWPAAWKKAAAPPAQIRHRQHWRH